MLPRLQRNYDDCSNLEWKEHEAKSRWTIETSSEIEIGGDKTTSIQNDENEIDICTP